MKVRISLTEADFRQAEIGRGQADKMKIGYGKPVTDSLLVYSNERL